MKFKGERACFAGEVSRHPLPLPVSSGVLIPFIGTGPLVRVCDIGRGALFFPPLLTFPAIPDIQEYQPDQHNLEKDDDAL